MSTYFPLGCLPPCSPGRERGWRANGPTGHLGQQRVETYCRRQRIVTSSAQSYYVWATYFKWATSNDEKPRTPMSTTRAETIPPATFTHRLCPPTTEHNYAIHTDKQGAHRSSTASDERPGTPRSTERAETIPPPMLGRRLLPPTTGRKRKSNTNEHGAQW